MDFKLKIKESDTHIFYNLEGELDIYSTPDFKERAVKAYEKNPKDVIIDGEGLKYVDSTGLGGFMYLLNRVREENHSITMKNIKPNIKKLFTITKLDNLFIFEDGDNE